MNLHRAEQEPVCIRRERNLGHSRVRQEAVLIVGCDAEDGVGGGILIRHTYG